MASFHQHEVPTVVKLTERRMVGFQGLGGEGGWDISVEWTGLKLGKTGKF